MEPAELEKLLVGTFPAPEGMTEESWRNALCESARLGPDWLDELGSGVMHSAIGESIEKSLQQLVIEKSYVAQYRESYTKATAELATARDKVTGIRKTTVSVVDILEEAKAAILDGELHRAPDMLAMAAMLLNQTVRTCNQIAPTARSNRAAGNAKDNER